MVIMTDFVPNILRFYHRFGYFAIADCIVIVIEKSKPKPLPSEQEMESNMQLYSKRFKTLHNPSGFPDCETNFSYFVTRIRFIHLLYFFRVSSQIIKSPESWAICKKNGNNYLNNSLVDGLENMGYKIFWNLFNIRLVGENYLVDLWCGE